MPSIAETVTEMIQWVFPEHAGAPGQIHGGRMMQWITQAGTMAASRVAHGTVVLGVPAHWRELSKDAVSDPRLLEVVAMADIVSPWTVGRYTSPDGAKQYAEDLLKPDQAWCQRRKIDYLPVVFPGFSWHNLSTYEFPDDIKPVASIPRQGGKFYWDLLTTTLKCGARQIYVAMFDEMNEGTAIFKISNHPSFDLERLHPSE